MKNIQLDENEIRALKILLVDGNGCACNCAYEEMRSKPEGCDECEYNNALYSMMDKLKQQCLTSVIRVDIM